jgi:hypothetical protein
MEPGIRRRTFLLPVQHAGRSGTNVSCQARVVKLADTQDLGSCAFGRGGSSPPLRTQRQSSRAPRPGNSAFNLQKTHGFEKSFSIHPSIPELRPNTP